MPYGRRGRMAGVAVATPTFCPLAIAGHHNNKVLNPTFGYVLDGRMCHDK